MTSRAADRLAIAAVLAGIVIRAVWVLALHPPADHVFSDMQGYVDRAIGLASGRAPDRPDAFYPPGTHVLLAVPLVLAGTDRSGLWLASYLWFALSAVTPFLGWRFTRGLAGAAAGAIAAWLLALWPIHIGYAGYFLSETPSLAFLAASLVVAERVRATGRASTVTAGLLGGIAIANRPQLALNLAVEAARLFRSRSAIRRVALFAAGAGAVLALVIVDNTRAAGQLTGLSENSAINFYFGHCDVSELVLGPKDGYTYVTGPPPSIQRGTGGVVKLPDHLPWDQSYFYGEAFRCIASDGVGHLRVLVRNVLDMGATTSSWPQVTEPQLKAVTDATNALYVALLPLIVGVGLTTGTRQPELAPAARTLLWHLAMVVPVAILVFGDPRYRAPYDFFGLALAAVGIASLLPRSADAATRPARNERELHGAGEHDGDVAERARALSDLV